MLRRQLLSLCVLFSGFVSAGASLYAQDSDQPKDPAPGLNEGLLGGFQFRNIGPALMSGRIVDIAIDPVDSSVRYLAAGSGGVWKTTNAGTTWNPIFDNYGSYSIGTVVVDPNDRFTVWVGTGENNSQRSVGYGDGLYKSIDGGKSFSKVGLENSEHIAKIIVHPDDSQTVYVAVQGPLWKDGGDRGLYKTTDGGKTWTRILSISERTGVTDLVVDPRDPSVMYAASYQRRRHQWTLIDGGPESAIYKSTDGGESWRKISRGLPGGDVGRIGLAISPQQPDILYAIVEATEGSGGFFRSADKGESWQKQSSYVAGSPQYYQEIVACPHKLDRVYSMDTYLMVTEDGGKTFSPVGESNKHVDNHALAIDPKDEKHLLVGCDGGLYETWDRGATYQYTANLPITQFYKIGVSNDKPFYYVYGGTQDNATQGGPSRTNNVHGIRNSDWFITVFGDGFDPAVDPEDPNTVYSQWQYGGLVRHDRKTGETIDIKPQEEKGGVPLRWNWDSPLLISPHNSKRIYYASQMLFVSDDRGDTWKAISPDLTRQIDRNQLKVMGRVWSVDAVAKNTSTSFYGSIISIDESPLVPGLLYAGTDDGLVQVSEDGGQNWRKIEKFGTLDVPEYGYINDIEASLHDPNTVFVTITNFKRGDFRPYILKSTDRGANWSVITADLPERGSVFTLKQDHVNANLIFCGTEFGVYCTLDGGQKWIKLGGGLPTIMVRELEIQRRENDLVLGTFGRGIYILDDYSPLRAVSTAMVEEPAKIFSIKPGLMYVPAAPLAAGGAKAFQGASFYTAPNPEFGVTFTYYVKESVKSKKSQRVEKEQKAAASGGDTPYPTWDELKAEDREQAPKAWLTIRDAAGAIVTRLPASLSRGIHRATWNYELPSVAPLASGSRPTALPGKYSVSYSQVIEGETKELVAATEFEVQPLGWDGVTPEQRGAYAAFNTEVAKVQRVVMAAQQMVQDTREQIDFIQRMVDTTPKLDASFAKEVRELGLRLEDLAESFSGDGTKPKRSEPGVPGMMDRLQTVIQGSYGVSTGPTNTHRRLLAIVSEEYAAVEAKLRQLIEQDLPNLNQRLEDAGAPWTPGRRIPVIK
jgi:photosystem II stability/assembly factor-like uncharacterized protein